MAKKPMGKGKAMPAFMMGKMPKGKAGKAGKASTTAMPKGKK